MICPRPGFTNQLRFLFRITALAAILLIWASGVLLMFIKYGLVGSKFHIRCQNHFRHHRPVDHLVFELAGDAHAKGSRRATILRAYFAHHWCA